jgi:hypothetical protein
MKRVARLDLENACVAYSNIRKDGDRIIAEGKTLRHPKGYIAKSYIEDDIGNIGFSSRSLGQMKPGSNSHVDPKTLMAFTYDFVWRPSHENAVIVEILSESESGLSIITKMEQDAAALMDLMESEDYTQILRESENATMADCGCVGKQCDIITESNLKSIKDIMLEMESQHYVGNTKKIKFILN